MHLSLQNKWILLILLAMFALSTIKADAGEISKKSSLPEGNSGIAAKYLGDRGIGKNKAVIFHESFEKGKISDLKANSAPDKHDGEQAFWIDGRLIAHFAPGTPEGTWLRDRFNTSGKYNRNPKPFEGFRWRTTDKLKINTFWLLYYLESIFRKDIRPKNKNIPYNSNTAQVWFDDIVIATEYIGPIHQ